MTRHPRLAALAAFSGAVAVVAGAFAAHGASGKAATWLQTGGHYQLIHALAALVALGHPRGKGAAILFMVGGAIFATTLSIMALGGPLWLGMITPVGGSLLIAGWLALAVALLR